MLRLTRILSVFIFLFSTELAMARWHESIGVVGGQPDAMQGAQVSFNLPGGATVPGTVEDDNGEPKLVFILPGDGPSGGSVTVNYADGSSIDYAVPDREPGEPLLLNLDSGTIVGTGGMGGATFSGAQDDGRFAFDASMGVGLFYSDHLDDTAGGSAAELAEVFAQNGVTSATTGSSNDDDAYGIAFEIGGRFALTESGDLFLRGGWAETEEYDGRSFGTGLQGPFDVNADAPIKSEVELYTLSTGYEHFLCDNWGVYGGIGYTWAEEDLSFRSSITVDGAQVSAANGSEKNSEDSWTASAGVQYYLNKHSRKRGNGHNVAVGAEVSYTDELLNDEEMLRLHIYFRVLSNYF
ncbi:MAG: outer membrane beta-barrel protein [Halioglobus sp.]|nr:outer membrane beta-barrel protein [Halioglobus sp.]